jgi:hypothetical protein
VVQHFDHALRTTTYDQFVEQIASRVDLAGFAMTADAAFGFERGGTPETVAELGAKRGFGVTLVTSYLLDGEQVRSSEIRRRVSGGDLNGARQLLGRPLSLTGETAIEGLAGETGGGAGPDEPAGAEREAIAIGRRLIFDVPVCLPPDGEYSVFIGPAWALGSPPLPATTAGVATIAAGTVTVIPADGAVEGRVRVVLEGGESARP